MTQQDAVNAMCKKLGIRWKDIGLLHVALTHSSFSFEKKDRLKSNQRLEFLGDAVLELIVSEYLFDKFPAFTEGELTKLRASIVCEPSLARVARDLNIGPCLYMGKG